MEGGYLIPHVAFTVLNTWQIFGLYCDNNISEFKESSSVVLSNGDLRFEKDVEEDSTENFILKPNDFNVKHCYSWFM